MPLPVAPVLLSAAVVAALALLARKPVGAPGPVVEPRRPPIPPDVSALNRIPLATGGADAFPANVPTVTVNTPSGVFIRSDPRVVGTFSSPTNNIVARAAKDTELGLFESGPPSPPTPGAPAGWQKVRTAQGIDGFVSSELVTFDPFVPPTTSTAGVYYGYGPGFRRTYAERWRMMHHGRRFR